MTGEMACARCGRRVPVRFGVMPRRCACGAEFEWAPFAGAGRAAAVLAALALLMSPLLLLMWAARPLLQDSIVLYVIALAAALYWLRVCETLLVHLGLLRMEGVDVAQSISRPELKGPACDGHNHRKLRRCERPCHRWVERTGLGVGHALEP